MKILEAHLVKKGMSSITIKRYLTIAASFMEWLAEEYLSLNICRSSDIMAYLQLLKEKGNQNQTIAHKLRVICLVFESRDIHPNPAGVLHIKGIHRSVPTHLLSEEELDEIYNNYPQNSLIEKRDKVIIGLIIYQAISKGSLVKLLIDDVENNLIEVPSSRRSNPRKLLLCEQQLPVINTYCQKLRSQIMRQPTNYFIVSTRQNKPHSVVSELVKKLKKHSPKVKSIDQLRGSRIAIWLKTHNLRQVQQMAGHRYVSSTERYQMQYLEDLQKDLMKYHPRK